MKIHDFFEFPLWRKGSEGLLAFFLNPDGAEAKTKTNESTCFLLEPKTSPNQMSCRPTVVFR